MPSGEIARPSNPRLGSRPEVSVGGVAVLAGNLGIGTLLGAAAAPQPAAAAPWLVLAALALTSATLIGRRWIWTSPRFDQLNGRSAG